MNLVILLQLFLFDKMIDLLSEAFWLMTSPGDSLHIALILRQPK